jgi:hypothetical protein
VTWYAFNALHSGTLLLSANEKPWAVAVRRRLSLAFFHLCFLRFEGLYTTD